ncbi:hypothetical protein EV401DRAFT_2013495 [Pisolithus croceorrhizus]|nr:hypothetical protein EV401DRAFT_2013495 [Pisolithus croceorrhizus]
MCQAYVCLMESSQDGVLIEPRPEYAIDVEDEKQVAEFRNLIWPVVEETNKDAPNFNRSHTGYE